MSHQTNFKARPKLLEKREAKADRDRIDREQNALVKKRSGGQCEVFTSVIMAEIPKLYVRRCARRASHVHHLKSGIGRRNVGDSISARCKLHVCDNCHSEIHGHVLKPINERDRYEAATVRYERVR